MTPEMVDLPKLQRPQQGNEGVPPTTRGHSNQTTQVERAPLGARV
jgi:hypothetical protein